MIDKPEGGPTSLYRHVGIRERDGAVPWWLPSMILMFLIRTVDSVILF